MKRWPFRIAQWSREEVNRAVDNEKWQEFRRSLKGVGTSRKLERLMAYRQRENSIVANCQTDNYVNALKRGGQLDSNGNVVR